MRACALAIATLLMAASAQASQIYTERAAFESALGYFSIEDFESASIVGTAIDGATASQSFTDFSVSSNPNAVKVLDMVIVGAGNTTPGGKQYLLLDTDILQGSVTTITLDFAVKAIGFDYSGLSEPGTSPTVTIGGDESSIDPNVWPPTNFNRVLDDLFWGFISDEFFTTIVIDSDTDSAYGIDQVTYSTAPEPGTAILLAMGLGLLASRGRAR